MRLIMIAVILLLGVWLILWINTSNPDWKFADILPFSKTLLHTTLYNLACLFVLGFSLWRMAVVYKYSQIRVPVGKFRYPKPGGLGIAKLLGVAGVVALLFYIKNNVSLDSDFFDILPFDVEHSDRPQLAAFATFCSILLMAVLIFKIFCYGRDGLGRAQVRNRRFAGPARAPGMGAYYPAGSPRRRIRKKPGFPNQYTQTAGPGGRVPPNRSYNGQYGASNRNQ